MTEAPLIYAALADMLAECEAIGKNRSNQQQGWKFRGVDDAYNVVHPLLAKYKVFPAASILEESREERTTSKGGVLIYTRLRVKYTFFAKDGSNVATEAVGEGMDSGDKSSSKAMSIAYKYALFQLLCIPTEALVDPDMESHDVAPRKQPPKQNGQTPKEKAQDDVAEQARKAAAIGQSVDALLTSAEQSTDGVPSTILKDAYTKLDGLFFSHPSLAIQFAPLGVRLILCMIDAGNVDGAAKLVERWAKLFAPDQRKLLDDMLAGALKRKEVVQV